MGALPKISAPRPTQVHDRTRLFRRLDATRRHRAVWISGLPGAGKTTLVASWLARRRLRTLWYDVDAGDADVASFFYHLRLAARAAGARGPLPSFEPEYGGGLAAFSRRFFRELAARVRPPFALVLDDVHELPPDAALHEAVRHGIAELPPGAAVVLVSRTEPPPALARLRAYRTLAIVDGDELRLSPREARGIALARRAGVSASRAAALAARVDGWTAGLVLLLEHERQARAPRSRPPELATQESFDFFAGEILARIDAPVRDVLLATALLPEATPEAARRLTGRDDAPRVLAELARRGYFTTRLARSGRFAYHPLFREFLLARGRELVPPARLAGLRRECARILEEEGDVDAAVALLREDARWDDLVRAAAREAPHLASTGRGDTLLRWVRAVPAEALEREPALLHWIGAAHLPSSPAEARRWHERAFELLDERGDAAGTYLAWSAAVETYVREWSDFRGLDRWIAALERVRTRHGAPPPGEIAARVALAAFAALAFHRPDHPALPEVDEQVLAIALEPRAPLLIRVVAGTYLVVHDGWFLGDLERARRVVDALAPLARAPDVDPATAILWRSGESPYRWNAGAPEQAGRVAAEGLELARKSGLHGWDFMLHLQTVWSALAGDEPGEAQRALERTRAAIRPESRLQEASCLVAAALVALRLGDHGRALRLGGAAAEASAAAGYPFAEALARLAAARARGRLDRPPPDDGDLAAAERIGAGMRSAFLGYECALARAKLALDRGDGDAALGPLGAALALGRERGLGAHLCFGRGEIAELCALALERGVEPGEARRLVLSRGCAPPERARDLEEWPWPLEIRTLGGFELRRDGETVAHAARVHRRPLELLQLLVSVGEGGAAQERIEETLWPDAEGDAAHHALETTLYRLRGLLGVPGAVVQRERHVAIDRDRCFVDAWSLERRLSRGLALLERTDGREAEVGRVAAAAAALARGQFLGDDPAPPWCEAYRAHLAAKLRRFLAAWTGRSAASAGSAVAAARTPGSA